MESDANPFRAPLARVHDPSDAVPGNFLPEGRRVPAGNGYRWLSRGWELFRSAPGTWIAITLAFVVAMILISLIPVVNLAANLLVPVFIGGIAIGCRAIDEGEGIRFEHLFAGFSRNLGGLLLVGLLNVLIWLVVVVAFGVVLALGAVRGVNELWPALIIVLLLVLIFVPLAMSVWLAPPLVVFHQFSAWQAIRTSFFVSLRNTMPFLVYGLLALCAALLASLPLMLGWLVLGPVFYASLYAVYRDLFFDE